MGISIAYESFDWLFNQAEDDVENYEDIDDPTSRGGYQRPAPPPPAPLAPGDNTEAVAAQTSARERQRRQARAAGGRASTILTSPLGLTSPPDNALNKTILGG